MKKEMTPISAEEASKKPSEAAKEPSQKPSKRS